MSIPTEEYGLELESDISYITYAQVEKYHSPEECRHFCRWMHGQTVMGLKSGESGIYTWDYERWLREGRKTEQNTDTWD